MNKKMYEELVKKHSPKENKLGNYFISFFIGGLMGVFGQLISQLYIYLFNISVNASYLYVMITLVVVASILTGFGFFDKVVSFAKCGLIVPTTGFAHAMTSSTMDCRKEGYVKGLGTNIYKLTGSIITYGILSAAVMAFIKGVLL